jgi:hypothetical protein
MPDLTKMEDASYKYLLAREARYSKLIQNQLAEALTSIYGTMKKIYDLYAVNGKLTRAQMTAYNKYSTMEKQILDILDPAIKKNIKTIKHLLPTQFQESFFQYAWAIDQASGVRLSWGLVNTKQLLGAFDITNPKNIELKEALHNYSIEAKKRVRAALLNGLSLGKSYSKMAKDLETAVTATYKRCLMTIRTEGQTAINAGQALAYGRAIQNGIEGVEVWSSAHDARTRYDHGRMDGAKRIVNEKQDGWIDINGNYVLGPGGEWAPYPGYAGLSVGQRANERCLTRFQIEGYEPQLMRTREEGVLPYQNFIPYAEQYHPEWPARGLK